MDNQQLFSVTSEAPPFARAVKAPQGLNIQLVVFDESRYYRDDVLKLAGKVFQVYAYDANLATHCCEITPSYELHPVSTQALNCPESEMERDKISEMLLSVQHDVIFMQCRSVSAMSGRFRRAYHAIDRDLEVAYDEQLAAVLEQIRCNPPCLAPGRNDCVLI